MIIDSFSFDELRNIKEICKDYNTNQIKDYVQDYIINKSLRGGHKNIAYMFYTGFGKTRTAIKIKDRFLIKKPDAKINVVSPSGNLQKRWAGEDVKLNSYVINSFTMNFSDEKRNCNLLFVDEAHHCLNEDSIYFSNLIKCNADYKILLSASLSKKHLNYLKRNNFSYVFELKISDGQFLGLIPEFSIFNLPIDLTLTEKIKYAKEQEIIDKYIDLFSPLTIAFEDSEYMTEKFLSAVLLTKGKKARIDNLEKDASEWLDYIYKVLIDNNRKIKDKDIIIFCAKTLKMALLRREGIISDAVNKINTLIELIKEFDRKNIIFTKGKTTSIKVEQKLNSINIKAKTYNSDVSDKLKKLTLEAFEHNMIKSLICINELKEGLDIADIDFIIRHSFNGSQVDAQQILGRALRLDENNPNKHSLLINVYVKNFNYSSKHYKSSDISKLEYAYKGLQVKWIESIENIKSAINNAEEIC